MKKRNTVPGNAMFRSGAMKSVSIAMIALFCVHFFILPSLYAITVEEAAGKRERAQSSEYNDEFAGRAQERRDAGTGYQEKDPRLACMLSLIIPGGGHIYVRDDLKGIGFCMLTGAGYAASAYYMYSAIYQTDTSTDRKSQLIISGLLFVVAAIIHVVGVVEAYNDTLELNEKRFYYGANREQTPYVARIIREK